MTDTFDVVRPYDPEVIEAIGQRPNAGKLLIQYAQERNLSLLELPETCKPVLYRCRQLTRTQRRRCKEWPATSYAQCELAFKYGLVEILNTEQGNLTPHRAGPGDPVTDDELDRLGVGDDDIHDVGMAIYARSVVKKGLPPHSPVLDSSREGCYAALSLLAEKLKTQLSETED